MGLVVQVGGGASGIGCTIALHGALTAATVGVLEGALSLHLATRPALLVLDLAALHLCDATGAAMIRAAFSAGCDCGVPVVLAAAPAVVLHALESAGALDAIPVYRTSAGAAHRDPCELLGHQRDHR